MTTFIKFDVSQTYQQVLKLFTIISEVCSVKTLEYTRYTISICEHGGSVFYFYSPIIFPSEFFPGDIIWFKATFNIAIE